LSCTYFVEEDEKEELKEESEKEVFMETEASQQESELREEGS
jgi:hypothetical protein